MDLQSNILVSERFLPPLNFVKVACITFVMGIVEIIWAAICLNPSCLVVPWNPNLCHRQGGPDSPCHLTLRVQDF